MSDAPFTHYEKLRAWGFAQGSYFCFCGDCGKQHTADKRASRCLKCAETRADLPPTPDQIMADPRVRGLIETCTEARRAIGDHFSPGDCYSTGPLTGDYHRDFVECPACSFIAMYDAALAQLKKPNP